MKRFFTFLMAVWALLSISQTVKAADYCIMGSFVEGQDVGGSSSTETGAKYYLLGNMNGWGNDEATSKNYPFTTTDNVTYTCTLSGQSGKLYFKPKSSADGTWLAPGNTDAEITTEYQSTTAGDGAWVLVASSDKTYTITLDCSNAATPKIKYDVSEGGSTGGGPEGGSGTTVNWNTVSENRLTAKPRVYSQGFYLAGNFFTFDKKDEINYDDAVFKFQQQNDVSIDEGARTVYDVYKVEIPASLTAYAQVMYVDGFGNKKYIFGPGSAYGVSYTNPKTDTSIGWFDATPVSVYDPITLENANYWNFVSRNESSAEYSDGMYNLFIAVNPKTHTVAKWKIEHDSDRRVAYFISDAPNATAMPVYDAFDESQHSKKFSNKFYASVNFSADRNYYVISNYLTSKDNVSYTEKDYGTKTNDKDYLPTTNKLFLQGNGGSAYGSSSDANQFSPNEKPMPGGDLDNIIVEYNPSMGNGDLSRTDAHLGIRCQIYQRDGHVEITSVSMVGDAIPGTLKEDDSWDYTSKAADMIYDDVEQCYTTTLVTTVGDGEKHFRFVGNHDPKINWFEDTDGTEEDKMAKTPYTDSTKKGHSADANDPNKVNYTQEGKYKEDKYHIRWNRPAGRWTVRLYFYTRNVGGVVKTDYYYTITANHDLVLRDFDDVVYKSLDNHRNILLRGGYKFFRTWSDNKAWKVSDDVDIFIVVDKTQGVDNSEFSLEKISGSKTAHVIPANVGVILATTKDATNIEGGGKFYARPSLTSYNTLVIPMEEYTGEETTAEYDNNRLVPLIEAQVVPTKEGDKYNYLFGFYRANKVSNNPDYNANDFLLGFWISNGIGAFYSNSAYLPVSEAAAKKMNLGVSYNDFDPATGAKKVPGVLVDFADVGGATGINEVVNQSTKLNDGKYYTLSGQQVEKPTAGGIYIHNGKKYIVK